MPQIPANRLLLRNIDAVGAYRTSFFTNHPEALRSIDLRLLDLLECRRLNPLPGSMFRFEDAAEALRSIAGRASAGQVVLEVTR